MKITLDTRKCTSWIGACEVCFGWHYLGDEIIPNYCIEKMEDDGLPERTFTIIDNTDLDKVLVVNDENRDEVMDSWLLFWEKLQGVGTEV